MAEASIKLARRVAVGAALLALVTSLPVSVQAQAPHSAHSDAPHGEEAAGHAAAPHAGPHASEAPDSAEHPSAHGGEHHQEFNWYYGMIGEKADVEPGLLWRAPGTPAPFAALLFNTLLLVGLIVKFAKEPVARGLAARRQRIMKGMEEAAAMKEEARKQLDFYRSKLADLDNEIERVKRAMRDSAEAERRRILADAEVRRVRIEQEARMLVDQELKALREQLTLETSRAALGIARELLKSSTSTEDHRRFCEQYLDNLRQQGPSGASGGRSESS